MVKFEAIFDFGEDLENKAEKTLKNLNDNPELKALGFMGISITAELVVQDKNKAVKMICAFSNFIPKGVASSAMGKVAATIEAQSGTKVTWKEL